MRKKNTIRDGGSTALYAAYTIYTVYTVDTVDMVYTGDMVCTVDMITLDTVYTIQTSKPFGQWHPAELFGNPIMKSLCRGWMDGTEGSYPLDCKYCHNTYTIYTAYTA